METTWDVAVERVGFHRRGERVWCSLIQVFDANQVWYDNSSICPSALLGDDDDSWLVSPLISLMGQVEGEKGDEGDAVEGNEGGRGHLLDADQHFNGWILCLEHIS